MELYICNQFIDIPFTISRILIKFNTNPPTADAVTFRANISSLPITIISNNSLIDGIRFLLDAEFSLEPFDVNNIPTATRISFDGKVRITNNNIVVGSAILRISGTMSLTNNLAINNLSIGSSETSYFTFSGIWLSKMLTYPSVNPCNSVVSELFNNLINSINKVLTKNYGSENIDYIVCNIVINVPIIIYHNANKLCSDNVSICDSRSNKISKTINRISAEILRLKPLSRNNAVFSDIIFRLAKDIADI